MSVARRFRRQIPASLGAAALILIGIPLISALPAHAASFPPTGSGAACAANPSTANCDGVDPTDDNGICLSNSRLVTAGYPIVPHYDQNYGSGPVAVQVQLWWSQTCQSNWARIVSTGYSGASVTVDLWRKAVSGVQPGGYQGYTHYLTASGYWSVLYTSLLYSPGPSEACATDNATWGGCGPYE